MTSLKVKDADACVMRYSHMRAYPDETIALSDAVGRILAQDIIADRPHPPYHRVMMDGIACRCNGEFPLRSLGMQQAGKSALSLSEGSYCAEVTTGSVLPKGAELVIPIEQLKKEGDYFSLLSQEKTTALKAGQYIHYQGSDASKGQKLLLQGTKINGPEMAILAANNYETIKVRSLPKIAIIATGDELVDLGDPISEWQVRRSNDYAILGMLKRHNLAHIERFSVRDDLSALIALLERILAEYDMVILSGGVSMGAFDFVPHALKKCGVKEVFHKILQRPGGPLWFGVSDEGQSVFGLPGNPVSAMVCVARYILPQLLSVLAPKRAPQSYYILAHPVPAFETRTRFVAVSINEEGRAVPHLLPTSGDFMRLAATDGIIEIEAGCGEAALGVEVPFYSW